MSHQHEHELQQAQQIRAAYLNALCRHLWLVPARKREETLREIATHVDLLVSESRCDGVSLVAATKTAVQHVGSPLPLSRQIVWQWYQEDALKAPQFWLYSSFAMIILWQSSLMLLGTVRAYLYWAMVNRQIAALKIQHGASGLSGDGMPVTANGPLCLSITITIIYFLGLVISLTLGIAHLCRQSQSMAATI